MADTSRPVRARDEAETEFNRIVAFTDGVFAIAITLLVLTLQVPTGGSLSDALADQGDEFFAYFLSFAVLARFWLAHHTFYGWVARFDGRLIAINLVYLAFVALLPFTTDLLGNYSDDSLGVALYAANMMLISASYLAQVRHVYGSGLAREEALVYRARVTGPASWDVVVVFGLSIPVAFISPIVAMLMWLGLLFVGRLLGDRFSEQRAPV